MDQGEMAEAIRAALDRCDTSSMYVDVRGYSSWRRSWVLKNGAMEEDIEGSILTFGARAILGGACGIASSSDPRDLDHLIGSAIKQARTVAVTAGSDHRDGASRGLAPVEPWSHSFETRVEKDPASISGDEVGSLLRDIAERATVSPFITSVSSSFSHARYDRVFISNEGTDLGWTDRRTGYHAKAIAREGETIGEGTETAGAHCGLELFDRKDPMTMAEKAGNRAMSLMVARACPSGRMPVILHPSIAGVFVHEAVGHAAEADLILAKDSCFEGRMGESIAAPCVNIVDDGTLEGAFGTIPFDDEGVRADRTELIQDGVLTGMLHTRETAARFDTRPTGNGRAESVSHQPQVRMSNTFFEAGDREFEELLKEAGNGVYVRGNRGGQVDTVQGRFTFSLVEGWLIEDGRLGAHLKDCSLSGNLLDVLKSITGVGSDLVIDDIGYCGKGGQSVPVDDGGPHLLVSDMLVGG